MLAPTPSRYAICAAAALLGSGCAVAQFEEPALEVGIENSGGFEAFRQGDPMNILTAVQSGLWLMPTIRYQGFSGEPTLKCKAYDLDKSVFLADRAAHTNTSEDEDWNYVLYNMPVFLPDDQVEDMEELQTYHGDRALFQCRADDDAGATRVVSYEMVLSVE